MAAHPLYGSRRSHPQGVAVYPHAHQQPSRPAGPSSLALLSLAFRFEHAEIPFAGEFPDETGRMVVGDQRIQIVGPQFQFGPIDDDGLNLLGWMLVGVHLNRILSIKTFCPQNVLICLEFFTDPYGRASVSDACSIVGPHQTRRRLRPYIKLTTS